MFLCLASLVRSFGHPIVVENMPGAGGVIGAAVVAKAPPDGFTLGFVSNNHVMSSEVRDALGRSGAVVKPTTPQEAAACFRSEATRYARLAKNARVTLE